MLVKSDLWWCYAPALSYFNLRTSPMSDHFDNERSVDKN